MSEKGRTGRLPGTQTKQIKEVDDAAAAYVTHRDTRLTALAKESDAKTALIKVMKKHDLTVYEDSEGGRTITLKDGDPSVKVADVRETD